MHAGDIAPVCLSLYPSVCLSPCIYLSDCVLHLHIAYVCLHILVSDFLCVCVCVCVCLSVYLHMCLSACLRVRLFVPLCNYSSSGRHMMSVCMPACISICSSVCRFVSLYDRVPLFASLTMSWRI